MKISVELTPKKETFKEEFNKVKNLDINCDYLNLPHLAKKWFYYPEELAEILNTEKSPFTPILHLRTQDSQNLRQAFLRINHLLNDYKRNIELLLITWDIKEEKKSIIYTHQVIKYKNNSKISVCIDNYKPNFWNLRKKLPYLKKYNKLFTQPIFNPERIQEIEKFLTKRNFQFKKENLFIGITWFASEKSKNYWHKINNIPLEDLPNKNFLESTIKQAIQTYKYAKEKWFSVYFMPIIQDLKDIETIQNKAENILV